MERNPKKISTKAKILVDFSLKEMNTENGGVVTCYLLLGRKRSFSGQGWLCKKEGVKAAWMGVKNVRRRFTHLHAKLETFI